MGVNTPVLEIVPMALSALQDTVLHAGMGVQSLSYTVMKNDSVAGYVTDVVFRDISEAVLI